MTRILMLVGVAAVAGAMYVTAASGGQQSRRGPTTKQFNALKKEVSMLKQQFAVLNGAVGNANQNLDTLENDETSLKQEVDLAVGFIDGCFLNSGTIRNLPVSQFGSTSTGYLFGTSSSSATPRTALDIDTSPNPPMAYLQEVNPACIGPFPTVVHSGTSRLQRRWAGRTR